MGSGFKFKSFYRIDYGKCLSHPSEGRKKGKSEERQKGRKEKTLNLFLERLNLMCP